MLKSHQPWRRFLSKFNATCSMQCSTCYTPIFLDRCLGHVARSPVKTYSCCLRFYHKVKHVNIFFIMSRSVVLGMKTVWEKIVVSTGNRYWLDGPAIESRWGRDFPHSFRNSLNTDYKVLTELTFSVVRPFFSEVSTPTQSFTSVRHTIHLGTDLRIVLKAVYHSRYEEYRN